VSNAYQTKSNLKLERLKMPILNTRSRQQLSPLKSGQTKVALSLQPSPIRFDENDLPRYQLDHSKSSIFQKQLFQNEIIKKAQKHKNRLRELDLSHMSRSKRKTQRIDEIPSSLIKQASKIEPDLLQQLIQGIYIANTKPLQP